ncbi:A24 family peptidase [Sphingomonas nostoxanthinifaciens]|uniref:A24 family peptidase n=1 Tax=Sphingomonas nostoxanthinifaciens TaxID=2872652 RepID=UPI001CC1E525|nr:prepilin peptidase [Sphingomonas nostoxanthinifaciens]UAK24103.1 prepilin peptidase [Sphingomonas nostoxanthinifaciens]
MPPLQPLLLSMLALLLVAAAGLDIRSRIIPNMLNAAIALLAIGWWLAAGLSGAAIALQIGLGIAMLVLFGAAFAAGMMGGGDVKLIAALALWLPPGALLAMLVWMAIGGGVLTLAMLLWHRLRAQPGRPEIPYGVAICVATLAIMANAKLTLPAA